jgi:transcriptional regulator with XRE-family HTH domain
MGNKTQTADIGDRLRHIRGDRTQTEFAAALGVAVKTVGRWEAGQAVPDGLSLRALMQAFAVDPQWLLCGQTFAAGQSRPALAVVQPLAAKAPAAEALPQHLAETLAHYVKRQEVYTGSAALQASEDVPTWAADLAAAEAQRHARRAHLYRRLADLADHCGDEQLGLLLGVAEQMRAASVAASQRPAPPAPPPKQEDKTP